MFKSILLFYCLCFYIVFLQFILLFLIENRLPVLKALTVDFVFKICKIWWILRRFGMHCAKGSPVKPVKQVHIGVWLTTRHSVLEPHEPGQGSLHFRLMQAKLLEHSLLLTHSGLQFGGEPIKSGKQAQDGLSLIVWYMELGPHWQEAHVSSCGGLTAIEINKYNVY